MQQLKGLSSVKFYEYKKLASDFGVPQQKLTTLDIHNSQLPAWEDVFVGFFWGGFFFLNTVGQHRV